MSQQASLGKQIRIMLMSVRALAAGYVGLTITISVIVGLLIGWILLGWVIAPVNWTDAQPVRLSANDKTPYRQIFLQFAADSFVAGDISIDDLAPKLGGDWTKQQVLDELDKMIAAGQPGADRVNALRSALAKFAGEIGPTSQAGSQAGPPPTPVLSPAVIIGIVVILAASLALLFVLRRRQVTELPRSWAAPTATEQMPAGAPAASVTRPAGPISLAKGAPKPVQKTSWAGESQPPLAQYVTTYALGDDRYDVSFSIETATGDFLGECGVGISETIGVGNPDKVTALEVWLFDKNDIRTLTKVLMSEHAFNDATLRAKLAPKGEAALATKGEVVALTTQTLKVNVRIADLQYGSGSLPPNSFFQQVTIELAAWSTGT